MEIENPEPAVLLRDACKWFGSGKSAHVVLDHLNMSVPKGIIYGLLGASGCGKTTVLGSICGLLKLNSGEVRVLGVVPGTKGCGIPGSRVGYMPQEAALVDNMSIENMFYYFGWMFGMRKTEIAERYKFLFTLLDLPADDRLICTLSGGQMRRVSLGVSLIQTPELLLLDEPTVGLDTILRHSIWEYLGMLCRDHKMTIIITTHYIEEARQAHKIGFLRQGILLAEASPHDVIVENDCTTLEEAYVLLSQQQTIFKTTPERTRKRSVKVQSIEANDGEVVSRTEEDLSSFRSVAFDEKLAEGKKPAVARPVASFWNRELALLYKDFLCIIRNYAGLFLLFFLPTVVIALVFITLSQEGRNLPLGIVNDEVTNCAANISEIRISSGVEIYYRNNYPSCHYHGLSCLFIDMLQSTTTVKLIYYEDLDTGLAAAKRSANHALVYFPANYSEMLETRHTYPTFDDDEAIANSEISVWLDMSDYIIGFQLKKFLFEEYAKFLEKLADGCHINKNAFNLPVKIFDPIYGKDEHSFVESAAPGLILVLVHTFSATMTATLIMAERVTGLWNRNLVAGAKMNEIALSQFICNLSATVLLVIQALFLCFYIFELECRGNLAHVALLIVLQSITGITFGLFISSLSNKLLEVNVITIAVLVPYAFLNGIIWPMVAVPTAMRYIGYITPVSFSTIAFNSIIFKGYGLWDIAVWPGIAMPILWQVIFYSSAVYILVRKYK